MGPRGENRPSKLHLPAPLTDPDAKNFLSHRVSRRDGNTSAIGLLEGRSKSFPFRCVSLIVENGFRWQAPPDSSSNLLEDNLRTGSTPGVPSGEIHSEARRMIGWNRQIRSKEQLPIDTEVARLAIINRSRTMRFYRQSLGDRLD